MSKAKYLILPLLLALIMPLGVVNAQTEDDYQVTIQEDLDSTYDYDYDYGYDYEDTFESYSDWDSFSQDLDAQTAAGVASTVLVLLAGVWLFAAVFGLAVYVYTSLTLMKVGEQLGYENKWFAWIPILNLIMKFQLGDQNPVLLLLLLIPGLGALVVAILNIVATINICEKKGYDKYLGLLELVPVAGLVLWGVLAWGKKESTPVAPVMA